MSRVTPTFREGNKADLTCYRTIGLLCCCSKVLKKTKFDAISELVASQFHASQNSLREKRFATPQQLVFLDKLLELYDDDTHDKLTVLYLNFAKTLLRVRMNFR